MQYVKKLTAISAAAFVLFSAAGCVAKIIVTGVDVDNTEVEMSVITGLPASLEEVGADTLKAVILYEEEPETEPEDVSALNWSVDNEKIVTVNEEGAITAVSPGSATVTATVTTEDAEYTDTCEVVVISELKLGGTIENTYIGGSGPTGSYSHPSGTDYIFVDEDDISVELGKDDSDDAVLALNLGPPADNNLYTTAEYSGDLTYSDDSVKLLSGRIILGSDTNDTLSFGDPDSSPLLYYTYIYATAPVTITGTDTSGSAAVTYSDVSLATGWNVVKVENPMTGTVTLSNGEINNSVWYYFDI